MVFSLALCLSLLFSTFNITLAAFCKTESQPNPIAKEYPTDATGTINGTVAILPVPYSLARSIVPDEYPILQRAYQSLLPEFPKDMFPAMLQTGHDHDVQAMGIKIPDFSRASISFPFVDRLNDGHTSMMYGDEILISTLNLVAILGTKTYGYAVTGGSFDPPCDAYACVSGSDCATKYFSAYDALDESTGPKISHNFTASTELSPYPLEFYKNVTNQPQFSSCKLVCDNYIRLFNTSVTRAPFQPTTVRGNVSAVAPYFARTTTWRDVWGLQIDNAFVEHNYLSCQSLQGYTFSGQRT